MKGFIKLRKNGKICFLLFNTYLFQNLIVTLLLPGLINGFKNINTICQKQYLDCCRIPFKG